MLVLVKATEDSERGFKPTPWTTGMMEAMGRFNDELPAAGVLLAADGRCPNPMPGPGEIEIRPLYEAADPG